MYIYIYLCWSNVISYDSVVLCWALPERHWLGTAGGQGAHKRAPSCHTCFRCMQTCRRASAGSSRRCRWARRCERTRASTAGCHCRQWICPPCWAPWLGWSRSGFGSSPPAGGSCAGGYCGGRSQTAHSYKNTHQRQETNIKSYRATWAAAGPDRLQLFCCGRRPQSRTKETFLPVFKDQRCDQGCDNHDERHSDCDYLMNSQTCGKTDPQKGVFHQSSKRETVEIYWSLLFLCA